MKRAFYVDYENVNISGLKGIESLTHDDVVKIFIGAQASRLTMVDADRIFNCEATVELISNKYIGRNALDFIIMVHMGYDIAQELAKNYYVISKDKGYDPAIHEMRKMSKLTVKRVEDITAIVEQNTGFTGKIKQVFGIGKVKETPDTTEHTVVGKGKKGDEDISKIKKEYVSVEKPEKKKKADVKQETSKKNKSANSEKAEKKSKESKHSKPKKQTKESKSAKTENINKDSKIDKLENKISERKAESLDKDIAGAVITSNNEVRTETAISENVPVKNFKGAGKSYYRDQYFSNGKRTGYHRKSYDDKNTYNNQASNEGVLGGLSNDTKVIQIAAVEDKVNPVAAEALAKSEDSSKSYIREIKIETPESNMGANIPLITTAPVTRYNNRDNSSPHNRNYNRYNNNDNSERNNGRSGGYNGRSNGYNGRHGRYDGRNRSYNNYNNRYDGNNAGYNREKNSFEHFNQADTQEVKESIDTINKFEFVRPELSNSEMLERDRQRNEAFELLASLDENSSK